MSTILEEKDSRTETVRREDSAENARLIRERKGDVRTNRGSEGEEEKWRADARLGKDVWMTHRQRWIRITLISKGQSASFAEFTLSIKQAVSSSVNKDQTINISPGCVYHSRNIKWRENKRSK